MQPVNDDMDDLFRRAAENYPLDTGSSDWNKVKALLEANAGRPVEVKKDNNRKFLWLLMLLPLGLVCNYYYKNDLSRIEQTSKTAGTKSSQSAIAEKALATESEKNGANDESLSNPKMNSQQEATASELEPASKGSHDKDSRSDYNLSQTSPSSKLAKSSNLKTTNNALAQNEISSNHSNNSRIKSGEINNSSPGVQNLISDRDQNDDRNSLNGESRFGSFTKYIALQRKSLAAANIHPTISFHPLIRNSEKKKLPSAKNNFLYAGIMAGADLTIVDFQRMENPGLDYGGLIGYRFGKRWSVEAAAFIDRKYYYTDGKYYTKGYSSSTTWVTDVVGNCRMWDLSIGGNYSFAQKQKSSWFVGASSSSYIMKKESYDLTYYYSTSGSYAVHNKTLDNSTKNYFSIINVSTGYTKSIGRFANLRIEPYVKIPVSGVGYANLKMASGGVHIGLTRKFF